MSRLPSSKLLSPVTGRNTSKADDVTLAAKAPSFPGLCCQLVPPPHSLESSRSMRVVFHINLVFPLSLACSPFVPLSSATASSSTLSLALMISFPCRSLGRPLPNLPVSNRPRPSPSCSSSTGRMRAEGGQVDGRATESGLTFSPNLKLAPHPPSSQIPSTSLQRRAMEEQLLCVSYRKIYEVL